MALNNDAKYHHDGKVNIIEFSLFLLFLNFKPATFAFQLVEIGQGKVLDHLYPVDFMPGFNLIGYANRYGRWGIR